jgi:cytochrome c
MIAALAGAGLMAAGSATAASPAGNVAKGRAVFDQQCSLCHSALPGQEGAAPSLNGVVGRKAAADPGFPAYSRALKASGLTWDAATLDHFLANPSAMVRGTAMPISLPAEADRRNVIAYLASLKRGR